MWRRRIIEDYAVVYLGSSIFKICRLLMVASLCVHIFACIFFRVKMDFANSPEDVAEFYSELNVEPDVSLVHWPFALLSGQIPYYDIVLTALCAGSGQAICKAARSVFPCEDSEHMPQLVCFYYVLTTFTTVGYGERRCCPNPKP